MESQIGLFKTELIKPRKPWKGLADVELATAEWVDRFNHQRIHQSTALHHVHRREIGHHGPSHHKNDLYKYPKPCDDHSVLPHMFERLE